MMTRNKEEGQGLSVSTTQQEWPWSATAWSVEDLAAFTAEDLYSLRGYCSTLAAFNTGDPVMDLSRLLLRGPQLLSPLRKTMTSTVTMHPLLLLPPRALQIFPFTDSSCWSPSLPHSYCSCPIQCCCEHIRTQDSVWLHHLKPASGSVAACMNYTSLPPHSWLPLPHACPQLGCRAYKYAQKSQASTAAWAPRDTHNSCHWPALLYTTTASPCSHAPALCQPWLP